MKLKDKARAKAEKRAARRAQPRTGHGPPIAADNPAMTPATPGDAGAAATGSPSDTPDPRRPR
jgi:hypothetical protein